MKHKFSQIGFYTAPAQNPPFSHTRHEPSEEVCVCVCVEELMFRKMSLSLTGRGLS